MKIFITGASGYIGSHVATTLRQAGHEVWGLVRNPDKAKALHLNEIHPVIGTMQEPASYRAAVEQCSVLIHAAAESQGAIFAVDRTTVEILIDLAHRAPTPKTLVYTSGVWLYGNTGGAAVDETSPLIPPSLVAARPAIEQLVLKAAGIRSLVLRPGCVYGKKGGLTGLWFQDAKQHRVLTVVGDGKSRWAMVHVNDLADGYLRAVESGLSGEIFNLVDKSRFTVREMAEAVARAAGLSNDVRVIPLFNAVQTFGDLAECLALDQHVDGSKAARLLGWHPLHRGFVDEVANYWAAWKLNS
jgi:nucleoside-diphosphate-sugar epimerase